MKKIGSMLMLALLLTGLLTACGGKTEDKTVDLNAFYDELATEYEWDENYMTELTDEMLDAYYPGLRDLTAVQFIARTPMMSAVVNELVFLECENEEDAAKAAEILQTRVDTQAEGGAWYPESMEAWGRGEVIQQGNYVAMVASASYQSDITEAFNNLFA